jgi:hypothetical protein
MMKIPFAALAIAAAAAIALAPLSVLVSAPANAYCSVGLDGKTWVCENGPTAGSADAPNSIPVCQQPSPTGDTKPCTSCVQAFGAATALTNWACGWPGQATPSGYKTPPCQVGAYSTHQPDCSGVMGSDGKIS